MNANVSPLARLSDTDLVLEDARQDIRHRAVVDRNDSEIGTIDDLFIDEAEQKIRMLAVRMGGFLHFGERHVLVPVDAITRVTETSVYINTTREHVAESPAFDPTLVAVPTPETYAPYYGHFGLAPFWASGYLYPRLPSSQDDSEPHERYVR